MTRNPNNKPPGRIRSSIVARLNTRLFFRLLGIYFCMDLLRPIHGGLGEVNIVASMIFGGISGSSVADTSALGSILIPAMEEKGYPPAASAGITVASSTMGMIIPPSTPMVVYAMVSGASIGALFMAGAVPGILIGLTQP